MSLRALLAISVAVGALAAAGAARAEPAPGHIRFRSYGSDDGLTALDVYVGLQDREGFIWAASPNGLFRFDGVRFRRYSAADGLPSALVTDMAVAPDGVLWGASSRGLFRQQRDRFVALGTEVLPVDGMHLIGFAGDGRTWVTTTRGPYVVTAADQVEPVPGWPGGEAFGLLVEPDGTILVSRGQRLVRAGPGRPGFEDVGHDFIDDVTHLLRDRRGRLWVRAGAHLWMQPGPGAPFEDRSNLAGTTVGPTNVRLGLGATGNLLVPTATGLVEIDGDEARLVATDLPPDARNLKSVWVDREGSMWLTSLGLHREVGRGLWRSLTVAEGLPSSNVWAVTGLADGRVAIGTDHGVALLGDRGLETITDRAVVALHEQPAGTLWIVTANLERYQLASRRLDVFGADAGLTQGAPTSLAVTADGALWIGTDRAGLYRRPAGADEPFEYIPVPGAEGSRVWQLAVDDHGLWVTTSRGLFLREGTTWRHFTVQDGLRDDGLVFIVLRRRGEVCVSYLSVDGVSCARYQGGRLAGVHHFDQTNGLNSAVPYSLREDQQGRLWVGGAQGVSVIGDGAVDHFTARGGAPGDDCNANASWVSPTGDVWLGTSTGLGVFDTRRYVPPPPPRVTLERGHLGSRRLEVQDWRAPIAWVVPYRRGDLDVEFAAVSFLDPRQLEYEVRLTGFDDSWRPSEGREVRYHRLPAGSYEFAARARYRGGPWGDPTRFRFVVATPWWETWWFRAGVVLALLLLVVAIVRWRSRALISRNLELEATVEERTQDLLRANERIVQVEKLSALGRLLAQLSHEINNPLNVVQNNLGPLEEYSRAMQAALTACRERASDPSTRAVIDELWRVHDLDYVIEDSAPAFAITGQAITRITAIHGELRTFLRGEPPERALTDLGDSLRTTVAMFARSFPDVTVRSELPPLPRLLIHEGRINQTITNLLQNAADAMKGRGRITLDAVVDGRQVHLRVSDDGPGVPELVRAKMFEPFFTTKDVGQGMGLGLAICREIIRAHGGTLEVDDRYTGGARLVVSLPIPGTGGRGDRA